MASDRPARSDVAASYAEACMDEIDRDDTHERRMESFAAAQAWATLSVAAAIRERFHRWRGVDAEQEVIKHTTWENEANAIASVVGSSVVVGVRAHKDHSWFAHCDGEEVDASSPAEAVTALLGILRRREGERAGRLNADARKSSARSEALIQTTYTQGDV